MAEKQAWQVRALLAVGTTAVRAARNVLFLRLLPPSRPETIVIHIRGNVGDMVVAVPAIRAVRKHFPASKLLLLTSTGSPSLPGAAELFQGAPFLDGILRYSNEDAHSWAGRRRLIQQIRDLRADVLVMPSPARITLSDLFRNLLFARLSGVTFAGGLAWCTAPAPFIPMQARTDSPREVTRYLALLSDIGIPAEPPQMWLPEPHADELSALSALTPPGPYIVMCAGGKQVQHRWPPDRFAEIGRRLKSRGYDLAAVGSDSERQLSDVVLASAGGGINACGRLSLGGTAKLLTGARLVVTNDTGPMHIAAAAGTPVVAVFSGADLPGRWYPFGENNRVLRTQRACPRCLFNRSFSDHCVSRISLEDVWRSCEQLLDTADVECRELTAV